MNSHDRIFCALNHEEPDHVPLYLRLIGSGDLYNRRSGFTFGNIHRNDARKSFSYKNKIKKAEEILNLGLDETLNLEPPLGMAEEYIVEGVKGLKTRINKFYLEENNKEYIEKRYITPEGELKTVVQKTSDWLHADNIPVFSDFSVSRAKEFLIKTCDDLKKFKYLLGTPKKDQYLNFKEEAAELKKAAKRLGVILEGGIISLGDSLVWLLGLQNMILAVYDAPDLISGLLDILFDWEEKRVEVLINEGIETLVYGAWYEITDFWTPDSYKKIIKPRLKKLVQITKQADVKFIYLITKSINEIKNDLLDINVDSIMGIDPIQGGAADLKNLKQEIGSKVCLWGGINSAITLGRGLKKEIEASVENAVRDLAPNGGFVLYPVDCVKGDANPWENIEVMINKWKEIASYPINF